MIARYGLLVHFTAAPAVVHRQLMTRDGAGVGLDEVTALIAGYRRVFDTLANSRPY